MSQASHRHLSLERIEGVTVVTLLDKTIIRDEIIKEVGDELCHLVDQEGRLRLLLNFSRVHLLSSQMIAQLLLLKKKLDGVKGRLKLCSINNDLLLIFRLIGPKTFEIFPDEPSALDSF